MSTCRTDQLRPGDRIRTKIGDVEVRGLRNQPSWRSIEVVTTTGPGFWSNSSDEWELLPSRLDEAVSRASELAEKYPAGGSPRLSELLRDFSDLLALFRAAQCLAVDPPPQAES